MPFASGALILLTSPGYMSELFTDQRGPTFLAIFAALLSSGLLTIRWLIQRSTRD